MVMKSITMANQRRGRSSTLLFLASQLIVCLLMLLLVPDLGFSNKQSKSKCVLFNFGDSNSDTGAYAAGLGFYLGPPFGQQFFNKTTGRFSNGRLYIDFICKYPLCIYFLCLLLDLYMQNALSIFTCM